MKSFYFALQHLTRISVYRGEFDAVSHGRMAAFFPVVGMLLGLFLIASSYLFKFLFPDPLVAALMVGTLVVLTGGLHLDGFMDTIDGVFSGRDQARKLEIMRDSRVGAFGVLGLACLLLIKYSIFLGLPPEIIGQAILLAMILSRWSMAYAVVYFPYVRQEGLGTLLNRHSGRREKIITTASAIVLACLVAGPAGLLILLAIWGWTHYFSHRITSDLGGLTGDVYGATAEIAEILIYLVIFPLYKYSPVLFYNPLL